MSECPICEEEYERVSLHWSRGKCGYPDIPENTLEIIKGLLMSDGWIQRDGGEPNFRIEMTNKAFLDWLDKKTILVIKRCQYKKNSRRSSGKCW